MEETGVVELGRKTWGDQSSGLCLGDVLKMSITIAVTQRSRRLLGGTSSVIGCSDRGAICIVCVFRC